MFSIRLGGKTAKLTGLNPSYLIFLAALICGTIGIFLPEILGLGTNEMNNIFADKYGLLFLFIILLGKILMTSICIGFGFFGGIFAPALYVGAAGGGLLAKVILFFGFSVSLPALALAGTAAVGSVKNTVPVTLTSKVRLNDSFSGI